MFSEISPLLNPETLCSRLKGRAEIGKFQCTIGATTVNDNIPDLMSESSDDLSSTSSVVSDDDLDQWMDEIIGESLEGHIDLDDIMVSAAHVSPRKDVDAEHLSKIWRIDVETAKRTLDVTTQQRTHTPNPSLSKNYSTNDRML